MVLNLIKRPFIILFLGLITLIYCSIEYYVLIPVMSSFGTIGLGNIFDSAMSFIQLAFNMLTAAGAMVRTAVYILGALIVLSVLIGLVFSGYLNIINNTLDGKPKFKGEFFFGIKKYFSKVTLVSFRVLLLSFVFIVFLAVAAIPAISISRAAAVSKPEFLLAAVLMDLVTAAVLFFACIFFRIYMLFWYPASLSNPKGSFMVGKLTADRHFWGITGVFTVYDLTFILFQVIFIYIQNSFILQETSNMPLVAAVFAINWVFKTIFFASFITYTFSAFKKFTEAAE